MTDRRSRTAIAASLCLALAVVTVSPAGAEDAPACNRDSLGQASCFSPKLCECIYDRGGAITGTPPGYRWDCGNLRPNCGEAANPPATINEFKGPYPLAIGVGVDRWNRDIAIPQPKSKPYKNE